MSRCEMCGRGGSLVKAVVEGSLLNICKNCIKFGDVVEVRKPVIWEEKEIVKTDKAEVEEEVIEDMYSDYGERIRKAREDRDLTQKKLAEAIAERESVIHNLESGRLRPDEKLIRKLEQFLRINLVKEYKAEKKEKAINFKDSNLTIGDLINFKKN